MRDEHEYLSHDGPEPAHWVEAEAMSDSRTFVPNPKQVADPEGAPFA